MSALVKNYNRRKIAFKKGKGSFLYTIKGKKYLDFVQGIAVNSLGHANPYLVNAINKQAKKVWHVSNSFIIPEGERLAKRLTQKTFADAVMYSNSGVEATEAAIKVARRYFYSIGKPKKNRILCIKNSFHGRTLATIFASGSKKMTEGFYPKVNGFDHFKFGDHESLKKSITNKTAAIMIETIMGEGGIKVIPNWCLRDLRKICNKKNILLILDEVQCGIGRSGKFFAFEHAKVKPDIVSTFGGNPLAMNVGNAVLDQIFKKGFLKNVQKISKYFHFELKKIQKQYSNIIKEVRGAGLLIGLQLHSDQSKFIQKLMDNNLLTIRAGENVIRILPPLTVNKKEVNLALKIIKKVCKEYKT